MGIYQPASLGIKAPKGGFQTGGWYNGRQYWNGTLSEPNQIHPESNQQGAGQQVSKEVVAQSNVAQGLAPGTNEAYLARETQKAIETPVTPAVSTPTTPTTPTDVPSTTPTTTTPSSGAYPTDKMISTNQPTIDVQAVYNQAYKTPEIEKANTSVSDVQAEIDATQKAHDDAMAIINDNPLYSASTMTGKADKLDKKFSADLNRLQNKKAIAQDSLAQLKADAEIKVNLALKQYDINTQTYKDQLSLFNTLLSNGALNNASGTDIASYAVKLGIPTSMVQGMITKQKRDEIKPQVTTQTDDNGNVTAVAIDSLTGAVLYKTSLGKIGKADKPDKQTAAESKETYANLAKSDARSGITLKQMLQIYSPNYLSPDEVYSIYNSNGKSGATETPEQLRQWGINPGSTTLSTADELIKLKQAGLIK